MIHLVLSTFNRLKEIVSVLFQNSTPTNIYYFKNNRQAFLKNIKNNPECGLTIKTNNKPS